MLKKSGFNYVCFVNLQDYKCAHWKRQSDETVLFPCKNFYRLSPFRGARLS